MPFTELQGSPKETFDFKEVKAVRMFKGPWAERFDALQAIVSEPYVEYTAAYLMSADIEPFGESCPAVDDSDRLFVTNQYDECLLTATYSSNPQNAAAGGGGGGGGGGNSENNGDGTFFTYDADTSIELHTVKGLGVQWSAYPNDIVKEDVTGGVRLRLTNHKLTWHAVPNPRLDIYPDYVGKTNLGEVRMPVIGRLIPDDHLLFDKFSTGLSIDWSEFLNPRLLWKIDFTFIERSRDWNFFYKDTGEDSSTYGWHLLVLKATDPDTGSNLVIPQKDFSNLFRT